MFLILAGIIVLVKCRVDEMKGLRLVTNHFNDEVIDVDDYDGRPVQTVYHTIKGRNRNMEQKAVVVNIITKLADDRRPLKSVLHVYTGPRTSHFIKNRISLTTTAAGITLVVAVNNGLAAGLGVLAWHHFYTDALLAGVAANVFLSAGLLIAGTAYALYKAFRLRPVTHGGAQVIPLLEAARFGVVQKTQQLWPLRSDCFIGTHASNLKRHGRSSRGMYGPANIDDFWPWQLFPVTRFPRDQVGQSGKSSTEDETRLDSMLSAVMAARETAVLETPLADILLQHGKLSASHHFNHQMADLRWCRYSDLTSIAEARGGLSKLAKHQFDRAIVYSAMRNAAEEVQDVSVHADLNIAIQSATIGAQPNLEHGVPLLPRTTEATYFLIATSFGIRTLPSAPTHYPERQDIRIIRNTMYTSDVGRPALPAADSWSADEDEQLAAI